MSTKLPKPVAAYFAATNLHDIDAMLAPFDETAIVRDEGQERRGAAAIRCTVTLARGKISRLDIHP